MSTLRRERRRGPACLSCDGCPRCFGFGNLGFCYSWRSHTALKLSSAGAEISCRPEGGSRFTASCSEDVLRDDGVRYHAALRDAGVDVRHVQVPGDHGCTHKASHADLAPLFEGLRRNLLSA